MTGTFHLLMNSNDTPNTARLKSHRAFPELSGNDSRYNPQRLIGYGAYSTVCSALRSSTGQEVAVKKIYDWKHDPQEVERTKREIEIMKQYSTCNQVCRKSYFFLNLNYLLI